MDTTTTGSQQKGTCETFVGMTSSRNSPSLLHRQKYAEATNVEELQKASAGWIPIMFDDGKPRKHKGKQEKVNNTKKVSMKLETIDVEGGEGEEKPEGDGVFFGSSRIRGAVGGRKHGMRKDSFNDRISDYISRAKLKFLTTTPTLVENGNVASSPKDSDAMQKALN